MNDFIIVSGFTKNTPYEKEIENLRLSLNNFKLSTEHLVGFENLGTWEKNCQQKALIIKQKLIELNCPVVWLDADAVIVKFPEIFLSIRKDVGLCFYQGQLCSGTLFFKPTDGNFKILDEWINENELNPKQWDQKVLQRVVKKNKIDYHKLPVSYCKVDNFISKEIVIMQNQASRRFKNAVKKQ